MEYVVWAGDRQRPQLDLHDSLLVGVEGTYAETNYDIYAYDLSLGTRYPICTAISTQYGPVTNGLVVVWSDYRSGNGNWDIYGYDLATESEFPICVGSYNSEHPAIDGPLIVWMDHRSGANDIYGFNLTTEQEFMACTHIGSQESPDISGTVVVWQDNRSGNYDIYGYDVEADVEFPIATGTAEQTYPAISGNLVVWVEDGDIWGAYIYVHDKCSDAAPIELDETYMGSTVGATGINTSSCGYKDTLDVWHSFTPQLTGEHTISLCGSSFDTTLAVYDECEGSELACNDDTAVGVCSSTVLSELSIVLEKDHTYLIRVAGYNGQTGDYHLTVTGLRCSSPIASDLNDDCKVDLIDLAILNSQWLLCNIVPVEQCW